MCQLSNYSCCQDLTPIYEDDEQSQTRHLQTVEPSMKDCCIDHSCFHKHKNEDTLSESIKCDLNDIYLPDEQKYEQNDNWSMRSYPVNST